MRTKQLTLTVILLAIFFIVSSAYATTTTIFESRNGRKYTITSRQMGTALSFGKRWLYAPAPILPSPQTNNRYVLLFVTCQNEGGSCAVQTQALYKSESTDGVTYGSPKLLLSNPPGVVDFIAPRAIWNGYQWNVYFQGIKQGRPNAVYLATGATLDSLNWVLGNDGYAREIITSINPYSGVGIGEDQQWFNTAAYGGYPGYTIYSVYNDWNYSIGGMEFTTISGDGINVQQWYGPVNPTYVINSGVKFPDVMLANTSDAATKGDPSFTLGDGCFTGQTRYRPVVGLGFYSAPYTYKNGAWFSDGMTGETYKVNPGYSDAVIETSGPNNSGSSPRFARNLYGYVEPVSYNPTTWKTFVYYNNSQINENDTDGCPSAGFSINGFRNHVQSFGVTEITITEGGALPLMNLSVSKTGSGSGTVVSSPAGITCGGTCTAGFPTGTGVTLTTSPDNGSTFAGWSGPCSGTGTCTVTMDAAKSVSATFNLAGPQIGAVVDGVTYGYTIYPTTTITIFGSGFSIGGNMVHLQRAGYADVWLYNGDGHYFWDYNGTQVNASLDSRAAAGTWTLTVRNASGGVSGAYSLTIQDNAIAGNNAYYCWSTLFPYSGFQPWTCNLLYRPIYCYTKNWQSTTCPH